MNRIYPYKIKDVFRLSFILECCLQTLAAAPMHVGVRELAFDARIQESIFHRLLNVRRNPEDAINLQAEDFHILLANILFRYPTVRIWEELDGSIFIEI